jgi:hypothetical protein
MNLITILIHASPVDVTYKEVASYPLTRLGSTVSHILPHDLSHAARVVPSDMARVSHASPFGVTGPSRGP